MKDSEKLEKKDFEEELEDNGENKDHHKITFYEMHCEEIYSKERKGGTWLLKCTLCGKLLQTIDYFMMHRGSKCPNFLPSALSFSGEKSPEELYRAIIMQ